ncbi:MAG TPA: prolyl oligopeptidase family serine peptidase, partial [Candidatus Polarisedimenticolia bacterium]|nr:prolyl oligopeptidase family serine peptidase [Candidatus Polarisedimenticolia bacterium]
SPDGRRLAFVAQPTPEADASEEATIRILDLPTGGLTEVPGSRRGATPVWGRGGSDGVLFFTRPFDGAGWSRADLFSWGAGDGATPRDRSAALDRDIEQIVVAPDGAIEATWSRGANTELGRLDASGLRTVFRPGYPISAVASSGDGRVFVRGDRPDEIWFAEGRNAARPITRLNADRAAAIDLPRIEAVRWNSGPWEVEGVLTRAAAATGAGARPLLVRPHGGPRAHTLGEFSPQNAWFAALGYLVLEPNFRGSTGYGDRFAKANAGDWGRGPFADVMAGVEALIAAGDADPRRLYLFGWSYGGIMANWAATHSDRFRAIVSGAGVADLRMQYILSDARRWRFDYFGGSPFLPEHLPTYWANSPVTAVAKPATPVLFIQGEADRRCPLPQALMMHRALLDAGGTSTLVIYPREGHLFREPAHIADRADRIAEFLAAHGGAPVRSGRE